MILRTIADKIVFSILNKVVYGYIEITTFSGQILKFGNPDQKLKATLKIKNPALNFNLIFFLMNLIPFAHNLNAS